MRGEDRFVETPFVDDSPMFVDQSHPVVVPRFCRIACIGQRADDVGDKTAKIHVGAYKVTGRPSPPKDHVPAVVPTPTVPTIGGVGGHGGGLGDRAALLSHVLLSRIAVGDGLDRLHPF